MSNYIDVAAFHQKFDLPMPNSPKLLTPDVQEYRLKFMQEELTEFDDAVQAGDLAGAADALIDLVYVAMGTAIMMGLPWEELWADVQRANMSKVRAESADDDRSKRRHRFDVVKPEGWEPPNTEAILRRRMQQPATKPKMLCGRTIADGTGEYGCPQEPGHRGACG